MNHRIRNKAKNSNGSGDFFCHSFQLQNFAEFLGIKNRMNYDAKKDTCHSSYDI